MRKQLLYTIFLSFALSAVAVAAEENCVTCHRDFEDETGPSHLISRDVHFQKGLGCTGCHGGDPTLDDMDDVRASKGYRGVPNHLEVPEFCARCHSNPSYMHEHNPRLATDQLAKYKTSVHGKRLFGKKDTKVANCISCHSVHQIADEKLPHSSTYPLNLPFTCGKCHADSAYMAPYGIPTDQLAKFKASVHGIALLENKDLGAPACNDCHGNHGAAPPGVKSLAAVCGTCHALEADLFTKSPHEAAFEENDYPMCETCHGNHGIEKPSEKMLGSTEPAVCANCHEPGDGTAGPATADSMLTLISTLRNKAMAADSLLEEAKARGMMTVDEELRSRDIRQSLIHTRTDVHSLSVDVVTKEALIGLAKADTLAANSRKLIDEYFYRRKGLAWASLFITILAIGLYLKIRRMG